MRVKDFPHYTQNAKWILTKDGYWTGGFWIGLLWQAYKIRGDKIFKLNAYKWLKKLESRKNSRMFDLGFLFYPSFVLGYKITHDNYLKKVALKAAETLLKTFNNNLGLMYDEIILNGKSYGKVIIDIMPNLSLFWWAYKETGDTRYFDIANIHSKRTIEEIIRKDFSTIQGLLFDFKTSQIIQKCTFQGLNDNSCWSRGQAWGIYGFILAHIATKEKIYLETAINLTKYFISNLPKNFVPYWDFNAKIEPDMVRDSSAAAIASYGLWKVYKYSKNKYHKEYSVKILKSLCDNYLRNEEGDGILTQGCFHYPKNLAINSSLIWGDYYFVKTIMEFINL